MKCVDLPLVLTRADLWNEHVWTIRGHFDAINTVSRFYESVLHLIIASLLLPHPWLLVVA